MYGRALRAVNRMGRPLPPRLSRGIADLITSFTFTFPATENPISQGSKWVNGAADGLDWHNVQTNGAGAFADSFVTTYDDSIAHVKNTFYSFANSQFVQGVISRAGGYFPTGANHETELLGRFSISAHDAHGYELICGLTATQGYIALVKWLGAFGAFTAVWDPGAGSVPVWADGDIVRVEITGTAAKVYINGSKIGPSASNNSGVGTLDVDLTKDSGGNALSAWSGGQPGCGMWPQSGSTLLSFGWKSITVGDL